MSSLADANKCLIVDSECIASVVDSHTKEAKRAIPPVRERSGCYADPYAGVVDEEYEDIFNVTIESLILQASPALQMFGHLSELEQFASPVSNTLLVRDVRHLCYGMSKLGCFCPSQEVAGK
jgi:hypothetical protein